MLLAAVILIVSVPALRSFVKDQITMKPAMDRIESEMKLPAADYDIALKGINVPDTNLKNFQGKTVFLNFWGTWCPPCRAEWPSVQKLYSDRGGKIVFVLIAMQDEEAAVRKFLAENKYTAPVYIAKSPVAAKLMPVSFPTTFVLGRTGFILKKEESSVNWDLPESRAFIDNILK